MIGKAPKLKRIKIRPRTNSIEKPLYALEEINKLPKKADLQFKTMIMLALNGGFGPKDIRDLTWDHIDGERVTLPRSKTGICQTYLLWSEICRLLDDIRQERAKLIVRMRKRRVEH